jgi:hypothetical protein
MKRWIGVVFALLLGAAVSADAAYSPVFYPKFKAFQVGTTIPLSGGKVYTYLPGTTTPVTTYQDAAGATPNTNPIILDSNGECVIYYDGYLKLVMTDASDVLVWTAETASSSTGGASSGTATYDGIVGQEHVAWGNPGTLYVDGSTDNLVLGWENLPPDLKPIRSYATLPACGSAVSAGEMAFLVSDGKLYTCQIDNTWITPVSSDYVFGPGNFPADLKPVLLLDNLALHACDNSAVTYGTVAYQEIDQQLYKCDVGTGWTTIVTNDPALRPILTADNVSTIACDNVVVLYGSLAYQLSDEKVFKCDVAGWTPIVIADNVSVALENFPSDLRPIKIAAAAPTCPSADYPVGALYFNTSTNKLNRCESSGWVYATLVADLQGEISSSQIADNAVVAGKIAANAVTASSLAADSVVAGKIAAGAIASSDILADYVVVNSKLAANSVTASNLAANSVIAGKISAGAVNASNILANGIVVEDKLAANAVTANKIAAGAIQAAHIGAGAITTDKLSAVNIVASNGSYLTSVGWKLNSTGLTTRYPTATTTYFLADGQIHVYSWSGSAWVERANLGVSSSLAEDVVAWVIPPAGGTGFLSYGGETGFVAIGSVEYGAFLDGSKAPLVVNARSSMPPSHAAMPGSVVRTLKFNGRGGDLFMNVSDTGAETGYSVWRTVGVASADLGGYPLADGSAYTYGSGFYVRINGVWVAK